MPMSARRCPRPGITSVTAVTCTPLKLVTTSPLTIPALSAGLFGATLATSSPPDAGAFWWSMPRPMKSSAARPCFSCSAMTTRRALGGRKSRVMPTTLPMTGWPPSTEGGKVTTTSPRKVVWRASSPAPQNLVCRPSVKVKETLSGVGLAPSIEMQVPPAAQEIAWASSPGRCSSPSKLMVAALTLPLGSPLPITSMVSPTSTSRGATSITSRSSAASLRLQPTKLSSATKAARRQTNKAGIPPRGDRSKGAGMAARL